MVFMLEMQEVLVAGRIRAQCHNCEDWDLRVCEAEVTATDSSGMKEAW